jgi:hypothetical protein
LTGIRSGRKRLKDMNMDMQELIGEMSDLIVKIKSGAATQGEIEAFAAAAAQLHERAIVLRYKSYEAKIFGTPAAPAQELAPAQPEKPEPAEQKPEPVIAKETAPKAEEVSFDLFEEPESDNESFDLFSLDNDNESLEEPAIIESPVAEEPESEIAKITPAAEEEPAIEKEEEAAFEPFAEAEPLAPMETPLEETPAEQTIVPEPENEPIPDSSADQAGQEQPVMETPIPVPSGDIHPVYKRLVTDDNSLAARLMAVRLETLKGAFGFNERLQIIRELFDGSNDVFSEAIEMLDNLPSREEARSVVSNFARRFAWDKDSDLALEFVQKVERRYA